MANRDARATYVNSYSVNADAYPRPTDSNFDANRRAADVDTGAPNFDASAADGDRRAANSRATDGDRRATDAYSFASNARATNLDPYASAANGDAASTNVDGGADRRAADPSAADGDPHAHRESDEATH